jgi:hypothetical protein
VVSLDEADLVAHDNAERAIAFADRPAFDAILARAGERLSLDDIEPIFAALAVNDEILGGALTTVVEVQDGGTTLVVEDARFFSDGRGVGGGDHIAVGDVEADIVGISLDDNTLTLAAPVAVAAGAAVRVVGPEGPAPVR